MVSLRVIIGFKKKVGSRDEFLFTNAKPIQSWNEYDLLIGDSFKY